MAAIRLSFLFIPLLALSGYIGSELTLGHQWGIVSQLATTGFEPAEFEEILFAEAHLPRILIALMVGGVLGLVGSLLQQLTQNPLVSPLTLGTSSGAWLALIIAGVWLPPATAFASILIPFIGAMISLGVVIAIVGLKELSGLRVVLAGMAVNILFGAIATGIALFNNEYAKDLFIWGAGDLAQNGWQQVEWLYPQLLLALVLIVVSPRILALLRLGQTNAAARGLSLIPAFACLLILGLWLVSSAIATVGIISFIGLIAPNIARYAGARTPKAELWSSMVMGACLLLATDTLTVAINLVSISIIPSGTVTAFIGAPVLIWFARNKLKVQDQMSLSLPETSLNFRSNTLFIAAITTLIMVVLSAFVYNTGHVSGWTIQMPTEFVWEQQYPRMLTAFSAGFGLAIAGVVLQRIIYNPLASPDILGISAGASLFLVVGMMLLGTSLFELQFSLALAGCFAVLAVLLLLGRRHQYSPGMLILTGIALTALIESLIHFILAQGNETAYLLLTWLSGSTYRVEANSAIALFGCTLVLSGLALSLHRWLTLISGGRGFAQARGLNVPSKFKILLILVAMLCAAVTATMGPVSFIGLLAPHVAVMLGAKRAKDQMLVAGFTGASLLMFADWLGQNVVYPGQVSAGIVVSIIGGSYFLILLMRSKVSR
ncbi:putative ABC-type Fe3+-siderophore transport system, permease component [Vibrio nigripulchritudo MADA3029]|uniref:Fe(3+)-hydroxamate ABC transporter permease FhuB n=1 Tax=Vibrio nigripulchritudo TaxID=28173 RepID=UPI0003B19FC0|nr:Fe(3+)-hydroxamate ABC transporter permease FhuB [Vibrio nigripulchritudo]CCN47899.1 putative ABC-type Fe3+-siderophore transport system, permease component [Vibrio nigripulchritudo MADA3020]CCN51239.1 putative ABC-type Fe3+-siderophore transport system, permease component [Vibrio nigripulchritudo MADA3021]CCN60359.1 putative ABC-type Fe3+-siderophore transport system, permease component [Vibrio nigripulchritudo MADA3029]